MSIPAFIKALKEEEGIKKNNSEYLASKYDIPLIDVKYLRTLTNKQLDEYQEDFFGTILKDRGVNPNEVSVKQVWVKDPKSKTSTFYSINLSKEDKLKEEEIIEILKKEVQPRVLSPIDSDLPTLNVYFSDTHVGMMIEKDALYGGEYNGEIFKNRVFESLRLVKPNQKVNIFLLGDIIDGWDKKTTRGGHELPQNLSNTEQFTIFVETFKEYFETLSNFTPNFSFYSVSSGNHDGDLCFIYGKYLQMYLSLRFPKNPCIIFDKFISHLEIEGHTFAITHGKDKIDMKRPLPMVLDERTDNLITNYFLNNGKIPNPKTFHLIKGDLHTHSSQIGKNFRYRNTLSLAPQSRWVQINFGSTLSGISYDLITENGIEEGNLLF